MQRLHRSALAAAVFVLFATNVLAPAHAALTNNALSGNALTSNGLSTNALATNALNFNALNFNAVIGNALASNALTGPGAQLDELNGVAVESVVLPRDASR